MGSASAVSLGSAQWPCTRLAASLGPSSRHGGMEGVIAPYRVLQGHMTPVWPGSWPGAMELKLLGGAKPLLGVPWGMPRTPAQRTARVGSAWGPAGCREPSRAAFGESAGPAGDPGVGPSPLDVNECITGSHTCRFGESCINTVGSFRCQRDSSCGTGYELTEHNDCKGAARPPPGPSPPLPSPPGPAVGRAGRAAARSRAALRGAGTPVGLFCT